MDAEQLNFMLLEAVRTHHLSIAANLIREGANPSLLWNGNPILRFAVMGGCLELLIAALEHGADPNVLDRNGDRVLHLAVEEGFVEATEVLLLYDDVNSVDLLGNSTIYHALLRPNYRMINLLLRAGAVVNTCNREGNTPLHIAISYNPTIWVVIYLLRHGASVNARNMFGLTALHIALHRGDQIPISSIISELFAWGANIDEYSRVAFHYLVNNTRSSIETVRRVIFTDSTIVHARDGKRCTPLHYAAQSGRIDIIRVLIEHGANVNAVDAEGHTPLHTGVSCEHVLKELIANGALVDAQSNSGETPLHVAARSRNRTCEPIRVLLSEGADLDAMNIEGRTPFEYCCNNALDPSWHLLLQYSILENYTKQRDYPHNVQFWLTFVHNATIDFVNEIEQMKLYTIDNNRMSLFEYITSDDWDVTYAADIYYLMTPPRFPLYRDIILAKLANKMKQYLNNPYSSVNLFLHNLASKSSFVTNGDCLLNIVQHLSNVDCLNFYLAGS